MSTIDTVARKEKLASVTRYMVSFATSQALEAMGSSQTTLVFARASTGQALEQSRVAKHSNKLEQHRKHSSKVEPLTRLGRHGKSSVVLGNCVLVGSLEDLV